MMVNWFVDLIHGVNRIHFVCISIAVFDHKHYDRYMYIQLVTERKLL